MSVGSERDPGLSGGQASRKRRPDLDTVYTIHPDGSRNFIQTADVRGRWQIRKAIIFWVLIAVYAALPWIQIGGDPAVHLDLPGRTAHLFGRTFTNQDFFLVFFLLTGLGFGLFAATSLFGRVWCGFACPQTVFTEAIFRRIERWIEGPRQRRLRRNDGPMVWAKIWRKALKHFVYAGLAFIIAHIFLSYFIPVEKLFQVMEEGPGRHLTTFGWTLFWTALLYFDYSWFREQTCLVICPYGRLQSALIDDDTLIIGYDAKRGEPRSKKHAEGGDCIDCFRCVSVCPTGIDIRRGLQMECVGCANCIDACDAIMNKLDRPTGLIRYDSGRGFRIGSRRSLFRPRSILYGGLALVGVVVFLFVSSGRKALEVHLLRPKGLPYVLEEDAIRNLYTLHLQNKAELNGSYRLAPDLASLPSGLDPEFIVPQPVVRVGGLEDARVPIFLRISRERYAAPFAFAFTITDSATGRVQRIEARFRGP